MLSLATGRVQAWAGGILAVAATGGLAWYLASVGLDDASKWAGVLGLFVALAGVAISLVGLRRQSAPAGQSVTGSSVGGGVTQIQNTGNIQISHGRSAVASAPVPGPAAASPPAGGQSVTGSEVHGPIDQIRDAQGDVDIRQQP
ncbi:hypothetical protein G4Z16_14110 [Streptomyces bathyalis]|uniref:Uncharacterized protein n=1 Tax=Streptomyces bathyalis TaxID=2710756 RepID=A0A7T1T6K1_9ACTN|nr:hypothetical protein [Streptomyces bathyalis]QPP07333.1 hypothetical protein G4Z16_14110 [Streptomyces bathyalis]